MANKIFPDDDFVQLFFHHSVPLLLCDASTIFAFSILLVDFEKMRLMRGQGSR